MVQSAHDRAADDIPGPLNAARGRGILVQGQMTAATPTNASRLAPYRSSIAGGALTVALIRLGGDA